MNYLQKNRPNRGRRKLILFLLGVFFIGFVIFYFLNGIIISAIAPFWKTENQLTKVLSDWKEIWRSKQALVSENARFKEKISSLELELNARPEAYDGNDTLLSLLGRKAEDGGITAAVLVRPPQTPYDMIIIDAGKDDGVLADSQALLPEGPALGTVSEIFPSSAKIKLFSSAGEKVSAVLERSGLSIMLEGAGGGNFRIVVPRETPVEKGDRILSADIFSRLLAVVEDIKVEPTDSFKEIFARSPANLFNIRFIVIRP
ncbi:MAG: rod shape-determining protein MreC [Patescibacteria group bacterium]